MTHSPGPQDKLLAKEAADTLYHLLDVEFARGWERQGLSRVPALPGRAVAAMQARLLVDLIHRLGLKESDVHAHYSPFYCDLLAPHVDLVNELAATCDRTWRRLMDEQKEGSDFELLHEVRDVLAKFPMTVGEDLHKGCKHFLCASQDSIARIVTLSTSGSTGEAKRLAFSVLDLERTRRFFAAGMSQIVGGGDVLLVCLPGAERPDGVADLLRRGLEPRGVRVEQLATGSSDEEVVRRFEEVKPSSLVLSPRQLKVLYDAYPDANPGWLGSFLVSADWSEPEFLEKLRELWKVKIIDHYGLTETCFGCALQCLGGTGFHIRHLDVVCEIIDPLTGAVLAPGEIGELVLTTLRQTAMPLFRYRTGDAASLRVDTCACSSGLSRIDRIYGRIKPGTREIWHPRKGENLGDS